MRSDWLKTDSMGHVLAALMPPNRLVLKCSMASGLRVNDVLSLRTVRLRQRMTVRELKTGKSKRVYWPLELYNEMAAFAGEVWVFESRCDRKKHRTRQAVWRDVQRAASLFRASGVVPRGANITPHSARKIYAVDVLHETGSIKAVGEALNHDKGGAEVTALYALADVLTAQKLEKRGRKRGGK